MQQTVSTYSIAKQRHKILRLPDELPGVKPLLPKEECILSIHFANLLGRIDPSSYGHYCSNGYVVVSQAAVVLDGREPVVRGVVADHSTVHVIVILVEEHWSCTCVAGNFPHTSCEGREQRYG